MERAVVLGSGLCQDRPMGMRQMTFDIPDEVAERFDSEVPVAEQSKVVTKLLLHRRPTPKLTEEQWAEVCEAANNDPETRQIQAEFDTVPDTFDEVWDDAPSR
jgi:hypothetical protein